MTLAGYNLQDNVYIYSNNKCMCVFLISPVPIAEPLTSELIDTPVFYNLAPRPIKYRVSVPIPSPRSINVESIFILNGCGCRITVCVVICIICYMSWISSSKHFAFQLLSVVQVSILYIMQRELIQGFYNFLGLVIFCSLSYKLMWKLLNTLMTSVSELILETDL